MGRITKMMCAVCTATGTVALSGLVASGAAVYSVAEGFKTAFRIMKDALREEEKTIPEGVKDNTPDTADQMLFEDVPEIAEGKETE